MAERYRVSCEGRSIAEVATKADGVVTVGAERFRVTPVGDGRYRVTSADGVSTLVAVTGQPRAVWATADGRATRLEVDLAHRRPSTTRAVSGDMSAPMPATVVKILVAAGERVTAGTPLVVLEAMKMELPVRASRDGVIRTIACTVGQLVTPGPPLVELAP